MRGLFHRSRFLRRALRVALCYAFALQAFAASFGAAHAVHPGPGDGFDFAICHSSGGEAPSGDAGSPLKATCTLCTVAISAVALPALDVAVTRLVFAGAVDPPVTVLLSGSSPVRDGLARAPPLFA